MTPGSHAVGVEVTGSAERRFAGILGLTLVLIIFICASNFYALEEDISIRTWTTYPLLALLLMLLGVPFVPCRSPTNAASLQVAIYDLAPGRSNAVVAGTDAGVGAGAGADADAGAGVGAGMVAGTSAAAGAAVGASAVAGVIIGADASGAGGAASNSAGSDQLLLEASPTKAAAAQPRRTITAADINAAAGGGQRHAMLASAIAIPAAAAAAGELTPLQAIQTKRFWALWATFGATVGGDIMVLNIVSSMVKSRGLVPGVASSCVIVVMASDTISRFCSGFAVSKGVSATGLLAFGPVLMATGHLMLAKDLGVGLLYAACVGIGLSDGIMWSVGPLLTSKLFGMRSAGKIFGSVVIAAACFALLLSLLVEPAVYQQHTAPNMTDCIGGACFAASHYTAAGIGVAATMCAAWLHIALKDST